MQAKTITANVRQRIVTVVSQTRDVDPNDIMTLTAAAQVLERDISVISRWVGQELPEITINTLTRRRYTLRSAVFSMKEDIEKAKSTRLPLLSYEPLPPSFSTLSKN